MKTKIYWVASILVISSLIFSVGLVLAGKPDLTSSYKAAPSQGHATVFIPAHAVEVTPGVFSLGTTLHDGRVVEGYAIIDHKEAHGKPTGCNYDGKCQGWEDLSCADCTGGGNGGQDTSSCYGFLAKGAKWRVIEPYMVDPTNMRGLSESFVRNNMASDIDKWETVANQEILGGEILGIVDGADLYSPDNKNEVYFGDIGQDGAIAITIVWGYFSGPPWARELVEWDQVYNDVDFDWSATGEEGKMDFESIATHELGHSVGLDDLYEDGCSEQTMFGYADYGEINKRTLENGDITGIQKLYGV